MEEGAVSMASGLQKLNVRRQNYIKGEENVGKRLFVWDRSVYLDSLGIS